MSIRKIRPHDVRFMVNPLPVTKGGKPMTDGSGRAVYRSANHLDRDARGGVRAIPHPESFLFVVV